MSNSNQQNKKRKKKHGEPSSNGKKYRREYVQVPCYLMQLRELTGKSPLVLACILDHLGSNTVAWPSLRTLANECGIGVDTAYGIVERLKRDGLLAVSRGGTVKSNNYKVGPTLEKLRIAWAYTADGIVDYSAMAHNIFIEVRKPPLGKSKRRPLGKSKRRPLGKSKRTVRKTLTERITLTKPKKNEKAKESKTAAKTASAVSTASFESTTLSSKENKDVGFAPEDLLARIQEKLGDELYVPSDTRGYRSLVLRSLNKNLVTAARKSEKQFSQFTGYDVPVEGFSRFTLESLLEDLLEVASRRKVFSLSDLEKPELWKEAFPDLIRIVGPMRHGAFVEKVNGHGNHDGDLKCQPSISSRNRLERNDDDLPYNVSRIEHDDLYG